MAVRVDGRHGLASHVLMRVGLAIVLAAALSGQGIGSARQVTTGVLRGAAHRIAAPASWNGTVVIFLPGYSDLPATFDPSAPLGTLADHLVQDGTVYAEAGYRAGGWAVAEALDDVERLRQHIEARFGKPKRVVLAGESMGGMIALALLERHAPKYEGGLAFCSGTVAAYDYFKRGAFDLLVLFNALFPSILPPADNIPGSFQPSEQLVGSVAKALDARPDSASLVMAAASVSDSAPLAELLVLHVDALKELAIRAGGNPFDNTRTEYPGLTRGGKRIAEVRRVRSDAAAERYLRRFYTPTAVVGFIGTRLGRLYEYDGQYGQIMALAVDVHWQRRGIGRRLVQAAEASLATRGARVLVVTSGHLRPDAHAFYERCGYSFTGRRYKKLIAVSS